MQFVLLPLALIFLFVLPFVAVKKPFNPKAVGFIGVFTISLLGLCFLKGWMQLGAGVLLVGLLGLSYLIRGNR